MSKVKLSVYVPAELHREAKYASIEQGTSIQNVVQRILDAGLNPEREKAVVIKPHEEKALIHQFREVLRSGKEVYINNCVATIRGTYGLMVQEGKLAPMMRPSHDHDHKNK